MTKLRFTAIAALACILLNSCLKSSYYYSGYINFANVANETTLDADGGITYNVVENASTKSFKDMQRIFINCDLLAIVNEDYTQDIKINDFYEVQLMKLSSLETQTVAKADSLGILYRSWTMNKNEAQYFNLYVEFPGLKGNKTEHKIDLVYEPQTNNEKEFYFYLYHDASDDVWSKDTAEDDKEIKGKYVSFRVEEIVKDLEYDASTKFFILPARDKEKPSQTARTALSLSSLKME